MQIIKQRSVPSFWRAMLSFLITVILATYERWSAQDLAWSFWLAGLLLGLIYLAVYQVAQGDRETLLVYPLFLLFFYFIFAGFLDTVFAWAAWETAGQPMPPLLATIPVAITHAARERWPFLLTSGLALLPDYVLDARTVNFTDLSKPLFGHDLLRMIALVFILVALILLQAGVFALYAILAVYFFPWGSWRRIGRRLWRLL